MSLEQKDIECLEKIVYKSADDIGTSIVRSSERLEDRIDAAESRLYERLRDIEDIVTVIQHRERKRVVKESEEEDEEFSSFGELD